MRLVESYVAVGLDAEVDHVKVAYLARTGHHHYRNQNNNYGCPYALSATTIIDVSYVN
jgi:hypothetical protein